MPIQVRPRTLSSWLPPTSARQSAAKLVGAILPYRKAIVNLAFPASCVSCRAEIGSSEHEAAEILVCADCLDQLELFTGPTCHRCGARAPACPATRDQCGRCSGVRLWFDETIALGEYTGAMRQWLLRMKHRQGDPLSLAAGRLIWQHHHDRLTAAEPDVVVPIPMHWRRRWSHGTNSAAVMAEVLADRLRAPLATKLLRRRRHTPPQFSLPPSERKANVRGAFAVRVGYHLNQANLLLVDDILTTGSTCSEAARALKRAGAARVTVIVAGRTMSH
jgi:ComF family protein